MFIWAESRTSMKCYSRNREDFIELLYAKYFTMEEEKATGCLGLWEQDTDYILSEWLEDKLPKLYLQDDIRYFYNQYLNSWSYSSCTIFAAAGMLSDLMNYQFTYDELKEIDELSYTRWRIRWEWWWVQSAVKLVADRWNERNKNKVAYYRISKYDDDTIESVINKLYTLDTNYNGNSKYWEDKKDWVLDWTDFWPATYGHSVGIISHEWKRCVKDSWSSNQIYELKNPISKIKCYGNWLYLYTKVAEDSLEEVKRLNKMKTLTENMIRDNSEMWHLTNDAHYRTMLHDMNELNRKKVQDIEAQLKKYL